MLIKNQNEVKTSPSYSFAYFPGNTCFYQVSGLLPGPVLGVCKHNQTSLEAEHWQPGQN